MRGNGAGELVQQLVGKHALVVEIEQPELAEVGADVGLIRRTTCRTALDFDLYRLGAQGAVNRAFDELRRAGFDGGGSASAPRVGTEPKYSRYRIDGGETGHSVAGEATPRRRAHRQMRDAALVVQLSEAIQIGC